MHVSFLDMILQWSMVHKLCSYFNTVGLSIVCANPRIFSL